MLPCSSTHISFVFKSFNLTFEPLDPIMIMFKELPVDIKSHPLWVTMYLLRVTLLSLIYKFHLKGYVSKSCS